MPQTSPQAAKSRSAEWYRRCTPANTWLCRLDSLSLLSLSGADSSQFLHGQVTNDIKALADRGAQLNAYCNPKGRLIAIFYALKLDPQHYYLQLKRTMLDALHKRLSLYKLRAQLDIEARPSWCGLGLIGGRAGSMLADELSIKPPQKGYFLKHENCLIVNQSGFCERYALYGEPALIAELRRLWSADSEEKTETSWRLHTILDGLPDIYPETSEHLAPQMVNLDLAKGLSFSKGCYPGQEVVSRTYYLGKLKRRMYLFDCGHRQAAPGDEVFIPQFSERQAAGLVIDAASLEDGQTLALISARLPPTEPCPPVSLHQADGEALKRLRLSAYEITMAGHRRESKPS